METQIMMRQDYMNSVWDWWFVWKKWDKWYIVWCCYDWLGVSIIIVLWNRLHSCDIADIEVLPKYWWEEAISPKSL